MADPAVALLTKAYQAVEEFSKRGLYPEEFLTFAFLRDHTILLKPGVLRVDWNRMPVLTRRIVVLPTVVVPDELWKRWLTDWRDSWEPDADPEHFVRNMALVVCRSRFNDNPDKKCRDVRVNSLAIAHVPDWIRLSTFSEADKLLKKTEENQASVICLTRLHKAAKYHPDYFCHRKGRQLTLQHLQDRRAAAGNAVNIAGAELLTAYSESKQDITYSILPPAYRGNGTGDLISSGGRKYSVWEAGRDKKRPDIHEIPIAPESMVRRMPEHGDFPHVLIDIEAFNRWPKNRRPTGVAWIIPTREDPPEQTEPAGPPAHNASDDSDRDSGRSSPAPSRPTSPAGSVCSAAGSMVRELVVSSSSRSGSSSDTASMSGGASDGEEDRASTHTHDYAGHSDREGGSGDERGPASPPGSQAGNPGDGGTRDTEDSSSDSSDEDESSDDNGGNPEGAQHQEEVYSRVLTALHKTAQILCSGYVKASSEIQPIVNEAVREAVRPDKIYIRSTSRHLNAWGQALHNMLNVEGSSAEEREEASRAARLAGLQCIRSLLDDGQAFSVAEEQDIETKLHDTIQAALRVANNRANKTLVKVNKRVPRIIRKYVPDAQAGVFLATVQKSMGDHYLSIHGMVMSQVVIPFHVARGTYFTSGSMFRAINNVVPGISAAATGLLRASSALPAPPGYRNRDGPLFSATLPGVTRDPCQGHVNRPVQQAGSRRSEYVRRPGFYSKVIRRCTADETGPQRL